MNFLSLFGGGGAAGASSGKEFGRSSAETNISGRDYNSGGGMDPAMWVGIFGLGAIAFVVVLAIKVLKD